MEHHCVTGKKKKNLHIYVDLVEKLDPQNLYIYRFLPSLGLRKDGRV